MAANPLVLAQVNLNLPAPHLQNNIVAGIPAPNAASNPPDADDVYGAVKLKGAIVRELNLGTPIHADIVEAVANYEPDILLARQVALAPQPAINAPGVAAPAPALAAPMAGIAMILNAIAVADQAANTRHNDLKRRLDTFDRRLNNFDRRLDNFDRQMAINGNLVKGTGTQYPYSEVLFLDGTRPTVATAARPALPLLSNSDALRNLSGPDATHYLTGYGIALVPHLVQPRLVQIALCIGCMISM
ncbi:hypothetical protein DFH06DRAFT_1234381 [Mycena polygramma]|nr:hypothetical protein DFH06DRAFT_1234381 [Mycena polygramma]